MKRSSVLVLLLFCFPARALATKPQGRTPTIVAKATQAVILITAYDASGGLIARGTGFFVDPSGGAVTCRHLLTSAKSAKVQTACGDVFPVKGISAEDDMADLLKILVDTGRRRNAFISVASVLPTSGERVIVVGSPLGLERTVTDGIVSAVRKLDALGDVIQISAPVSPGSSGSPLLSMRGEAVGVVAFYVAGGQNLNFAIPATRIAQLRLAPRQSLALWSEGTLLKSVDAATLYLMLSSEKSHQEDCRGGAFYLEVATSQYKPVPFLAALAYDSLGRCYIRGGSYSQALPALRSAIGVQPDWAEGYVQIGRCYYLLERYGEACETLVQALRIDPDNVDAYGALGETHRAMKEYEQALSDFRNAIRIKPDDASAHFFLGVLCGTREPRVGASGIPNS